LHLAGSGEMELLFPNESFPLQGKEVIEHYLKELISQGITFIPRWTPSPACGQKNERTLAVGGDADDVPLESGAHGTSKEETGSSCLPAEAVSPDGMHCPGSGSCWQSKCLE